MPLGHITDKATQRKIIRDIAIGDHTKKDIAKKYSISYGTLCNIRKKNRDLYEQMLKDLKEGIEIRSLLCSEQAIKRIKKDKLEQSTGLQLSQIAKNLVDITKDNNNSINIQVNQIPQSKDDLIKFVLNTKEIELPVINETANQDNSNTNNIYPQDTNTDNILNNQ